jgi:hypothetical protein
MTQRLKRWESPRKTGRNTKGRGGTARLKQIRKQQQMLRKKLKEGQPPFLVLIVSANFCG